MERVIFSLLIFLVSFTSFSQERYITDEEFKEVTSFVKKHGLPVVSQQQTGVSVTIHLSTRQSLQPKVVSLSSLYIYFSPHSTLKNTKSSKEFSLPATLLKMMNRHKNEFPQYF